MYVEQYDLGNQYGLKMAVVADLHDMPPEEALETVKEIQPDLILLPGDTMERKVHFRLGKYRNFSRIAILVIGGIVDFVKIRICKQPPVPFQKENGYKFLQEAVKIAPVIMSLGNHEQLISEEDRAFILSEGVHLLDNQSLGYHILTADGVKNICFGGASYNVDYDWLKEFSKKPEYKILLCHHPEYYVNTMKDTEMDTFQLVVAGHTHGGQWRLFGKGVYAPGQGLFPKYARGKFGKLIISAGATNPTKISRFHNPCEILVIKI